MSSERPGWLALALGLSLLLNLFLAGVVSGRLFTSFDPMRQVAARAPSFAMRFRALPLEERARFDAAYEPHRKEVAEARQGLRAARLTALGALAAPIYDPAIMQQDFDALRHATDVAQRAVNAALVEALGTLGQESRVILAGPDR